MKNLRHNKLIYSALIFILPLMVSCSSILGGGGSNDPEVVSQQRRVDLLEIELKDAERLANEAEERAKAAKSRLKAAQHELNALKSMAKSRQ